MGKKENKYMDNFIKAILALRTEEECRAFFDDVTTIKELQDMTYRLEVARLLANGRVFSEISKETGTSSATIGRVNKCLNYGPGGYAMVLERIGALGTAPGTEPNAAPGTEPDAAPGINPGTEPEKE